MSYLPVLTHMIDQNVCVRAPWLTTGKGRSVMPLRALDIPRFREPAGGGSFCVRVLSMSKIAYKKAKPPFDHDHSADIIIRTSDNVEFQVHKLILAKSSSVFDNILSLPHLPPEYAAVEDYTDGIAVICLTESSDTIDIFLRCCYLLELLVVVASACALGVFRSVEFFTARPVQPFSLRICSNYLGIRSVKCVPRVRRSLLYVWALSRGYSACRGIYNTNAWARLWLNTSSRPASWTKPLAHLWQLYAS